MDKSGRYLLFGGLLVLSGVVLTILGKIVALILFLLGLGLLGAGFSVMLKSSGHRGEGAFYQGLAGQGRQQSEVVKLDAAVPAENADIWKRMEQSK